MSIAGEAELPPEPAKACRIREGALSAFLDLGYEGTSVDEIARRAGVSKPTVYNHFGDKRAIFLAVVTRACTEHRARIFDMDADADAVAVEPALRRVARAYVDFLLSPLTQSLSRIAIAETQRFPEVGQAFYHAGPRASRERFAIFLRAAIASGVLTIDDVDLAAEQFAELCKAGLYHKRLLQVIDGATQAEIAHVADGAVAMFMAAYGVKAPVDRGADDPL